MTAILKHKLTQFIFIILLAYLFFQFGIPAFSQLVTGTAAPVPAHLLWTIYMPAVFFVMLLFVSSNQVAWNEFSSPLINLCVNRQSLGVILLRFLLIIILPVVAGIITFFQIQTEVSPPAELRSIHPADPGTITVQGETFTLQGLRSPVRRADGSVAEADLQAGHDIYIENCVYCHGDALSGEGMFADGLNPRPADFTDPGTIVQLSESYVFWRVAKGGPGLPQEGKPWNSAMPAWEDELTVEEMWQVIAYLYEATNQHPAERATE